MKTEYIRVSALLTEADQAEIERAAAVLRRGGLVVFPTETVYGLGGDGTAPEAAARIYAAKGRPADNPLILHIASPEEAEGYAVTSPLYYRLAEAFMPGPLTVILPAKKSVPRTVTAGLDTVALRCPAHPVAHALCRAAGVPIAAPSANLSGSPSPTTARHVLEDMDGRVDMILDGGESEIGLESTIVKIEEDSSLSLLRPGAVTPEELEAVAGRVRIADAVLRSLKEGERVLSPGMKYRHYAPKTPFYLLEGEGERLLSYLSSLPKKTAVFTYLEDREAFSAVTEATLVPIGSRREPVVLAHNLFRLLRDLDKEGYLALYAPVPPAEGLGLALYNRMIRAASHHIITV